MTVTPVTRPAVTNGATTRREVAPRRHGQWTVTPPVTVTRDLVAFGTNPPGGPPPLPKPPAKGLRTTAFGLFAVMTIAGGGVVGATGSGSDLRWALIALTLFAAVGSAGTAIAANTR
ncbi:hypothetical protein [Catenuloplanes indicus]|uniref:Uncharacterized protein n=1 Tax=Catenuloplanes indicus TaxID=137267 RepID=A0AAE3WAQ7_9ACTN|nr:hypothetical protein [Catenuloplanes indicus]MDQ0371647.1 hypothetical protein [Catenuloplanes indicus]